ncbi:hypothetical protein FGB62_159g17 [Gracilaria domingensis]|nr:hypothetical protein FGB62_159g17 [Gracilaria domingensis]
MVGPAEAREKVEGRDGGGIHVCPDAMHVGAITFTVRHDGEQVLHGGVDVRRLRAADLEEELSLVVGRVGRRRWFGRRDVPPLGDYDDVVTRLDGLDVGGHHGEATAGVVVDLELAEGRVGGGRGAARRVGRRGGRRVPFALAVEALCFNRHSGMERAALRRRGGRSFAFVVRSIRYLWYQIPGSPLNPYLQLQYSEINP